MSCPSHYCLATYLDGLVPQFGRLEVNGAECSFASRIEHQVGECSLTVLKTCQQVVARLGDLGQKVVLLDLLDYLLEEHQFGWIPQPGVENSVWLVRSEGILVEEATDEHLLAEGDNVRWGLKVKVLMSPELARRSTAGLNFVDDEGNRVLGANLAKLLVKVRRTMVVATFALNRLDNQARHRNAFLLVLTNQVLDHSEASFVFLQVGVFVLFQWKLVFGVVRNGPVKCRYVHFMDRLGVRATGRIRPRLVTRPRVKEAYLSAPNVRPWNPPLKERMLKLGDPGVWLLRQVLMSSSLGPSPPRSMLRYQKQTAAVKGRQVSQMLQSP